MLAGVIVIFLWKGFYGEHGMINQVLNYGVDTINYLCGTKIKEFAVQWLNSPSFALLFCLIPTIWAGMGPGCLIYLAALKGIPDDLYEAADIDGAGSTQKALYIAIPSIKALISINFIGAAIGCMHSGSAYILAMTGGGPYTPYGETEVIGLHIFWEAFGFLRFGAATAMAWVLGVILIGFTVQQLQKLSKMEFKAAGGK
jgi:multiple sugar transport system permease protein